jgi:excisionase family DNA binding protein
MDLREVRERTGLSEKKLRRLIREGKLEATMIGSGLGRHWEVSEGALDALGVQPGVQWVDNERTTSVHECVHCQWMQEHLDGQLARKDEQLAEMAGQIRELHVLLQRSLEQGQKALAAPKSRRWWPWG